MLKTFSILLTLILFISCNSSSEETPYIVPVDEEVLVEKEEIPVLNQFQSVWDNVMSDPLEKLPQNSVSYSKLFDGAIDLIAQNADRTLNDNADILEYFDKLAHPNGVCLKGVWDISQESPYGGYFKKGSHSLVIGRASSALSETKKGETRAFGFAIKLFGTMNSTEILSAPSANFFVIDDLGGTDAEFFTDVSLTNEPDVSFTSSIFSSFAYGLKVANTFSDADKNSGIRQLYEVSYLNEQNSSTIITPKWIKIEAESNQTKFDAEDFRSEFVLNENEVIIFDISVASRENDGFKEWKKIGTITFDTSVVSTSCDHRLHFHHPRWRDNLVYE